MGDEQEPVRTALLVVDTKAPGEETSHDVHDRISAWLRSRAESGQPYDKVLMVNVSPFKPRQPAEPVAEELSEWLNVPVATASTEAKPEVSGGAETLVATAHREFSAADIDQVDVCGNDQDPVFDVAIDRLATYGYTVQRLDHLTRSGGTTSDRSD